MPFKIAGSKQQSKTICDEAIIDCFIETGVLIKQNCRCCQSHLIENHLSEDALKLIRAIKYEINLNQKEVEFLLKQLRERAKSRSIFEQFKSPYIPTEELVRSTCGQSKIQFVELNDSLSSMNCTDSRTKTLPFTCFG